MPRGAYPTDLTDAKWAITEQVRKHRLVNTCGDVRSEVEMIL